MSPRTRAAPSRQAVRLIPGDEDGRRDRFGRDVAGGLAREPRSLPPRWLLDDRGVALLREHQRQPTSYVLDAERQLVADRAYALPLYFQAGAPRVVEVGVVDTERTRALLAPLVEEFGPLRYLAVGPALAAVEEPCRELAAAFPGLRVTAMVGRLEDAVRDMRSDASPALLFWPGGGVGDQTHADAVALLRGVGAALRPRDLLIASFDLRKSPRTVQRVYRDRGGLTKRLHLNVLQRIDDELGGTFDLSQFRHRFAYDEDAGELTSHLVSRRTQTARIDALGTDVTLRKGETIHTLTVSKFSPAEIDQAAHAAELVVHERWYDRDGRVCANLMRRAPRR